MVLLKNKIISLLSNKGFQRYAANSSWLMLERMVRLCTALIIGIWLARYLGPERFGLLSYAQSFVGIFACIAGLGLDGILIRELVKDETKRDELIGTAFGLKVIASVIVIGMIFLISSSVNDSYENLLILIIACASFFPAFEVADSYFQSKSLVKYTVFARFISVFIISFLKIVFILNEASLESFAILVVVESFVFSIGLIFYYFKDRIYTLGGETKRKIFVFSKRTAINLLNDSWPLILAGAASAINMRADQIILGNLLSKDVLGNYSAAVKIAEVWLMIPTILGISIYPALILAKKNSEEHYKKRVIQIVKIMSLFAIPVATLISISSNYIINILYGDEFTTAGKYLALYIWTGVPYLIFFVTNQVMLIENITKLSFYVALFSVCVNLILNFVFIPRYGGIGAIMTTFFASYLSVLLSIYLINKKAKFITLRF